MLRQAAFGVGLIAALSAVLNALVLVSPLYMLQVFDRVLLTFRVETLLYLSLIAGGCIIVLGIFEWLRGIAVARLGRWWDETVRADLLDAALSRRPCEGPRASPPPSRTSSRCGTSSAAPPCCPSSTRRGRPSSSR